MVRISAQARLERGVTSQRGGCGWFWFLFVVFVWGGGSANGFVGWCGRKRRKKRLDLLLADTILRPDRERFHNLAPVAVEALIAEPAGRFEVEGVLEVPGAVVGCPVMYAHSPLLMCQDLLSRM